MIDILIITNYCLNKRRICLCHRHGIATFSIIWILNRNSIWSMDAKTVQAREFVGKV